MKDKIFLGVNLLLAIFNSTLIFLPNYFVELIISFLPQILFVEFLILIILILFLQHVKLTSLYIYIDKKLKINPYTSIFFISFLFTFILLSSRVISFSFFADNISSKANSAKVVFFNKKYNNNNYGIISKEISELNPDIIAVAECEFDCQNKILALSTYKYSAISKGDPNFPVILLSKYELKNVNLITDVDEVNAVVNISGKVVNIIAVHPLAPVYPNTFDLRNSELDKISSQINNSTVAYKIILGDFNLSPWSSFYSKFMSSSNYIYDTAKGKGINTTWGATSNFFVRTHLDHIFLTKNISVDNFQVLNSYGSDHNMLVVDIGL